MDYTPITNGAMNRRGEEIGMWLESWEGEPIKSLVILDDQNGCYLRPFSNRLIRTSIMKGLEQKHVDLAVKMLEKPFEYKKKEKLVEPPNMVHYKWWDMDEPELCEMITGEVTEEVEVCFYCSGNIEAGKNVTYLVSADSDDVFSLHPECAKKSCTPV